MIHILEHSLLDTLKLVPFLFLTYLVMEYLEHRTGDRVTGAIRKAGKWGPLAGGLLGVVPQCGFSAAASNLYAGRVISVGTLLAVYLSTSDEMLPIMISYQVNPLVMVQILSMKVLIGVAAGFMMDRIWRKRSGEHLHIHEICEEEHCHCEDGILKSAFWHTVKIFLFVLIFTLLLNLVMHTVGEDALANLLRDRTVAGALLAALVGLIPNCASSVVITTLYLEGTMHIGALMAGLLSNAGVGLMVLFRVNKSLKENLKIVGILYGISAVVGILLGLL